ncbi:hypothetical protein CCP3SC1AL1_1620005 [Gammaproteobacteria bacterium]
MKTIQSISAIIIISFISLYSMFSFVKLELNFALWQESDRVGYIILSVALSMISNIIYQLIQLDKK